MKKLTALLLTISIVAVCHATPVWSWAAPSCEQAQADYFLLSSLARQGYTVEISSPEFRVITVEAHRKNEKYAGESITLQGALNGLVDDMSNN